jgi:hypothetical protein
MPEVSARAMCKHSYFLLECQNLAELKNYQFYSSQSKISKVYGKSAPVAVKTFIK